MDTTEFNLLLDGGEVQVDYSNNAYRLTTRTGFILNDNIDGTLEASGRGDSNALMLDSFILSLVQGVLTGEFSISRNDDDIVISSDANWNNLLIPINPELSVYLTQGNLRLAGELDDYNLSLDTEISSNNSGPFQLSLIATGDQDSIRINPLTLRLDGGVVDGSATMLWTDRLTANMELAGANIDSEKILAGWPGDLDFNTILSASKFEGDYEVNIDSLDVTGQLREYPLALQIQSVIRNDNIEVINASLSSGTSSILIDGNWGTDKDLNWTINAPDLSNLHEKMQGQLNATGHFTGSLELPRVTGNLHSSGLRSPWFDVDTVQSSFIVNQSSANALDVQLELTNLVREDVVVDTLSLSASGSLKEHRYDLQIASSLADLNLRGEGSYNELIWRGRTDELVIQREDENWMMGDPFSLDVGYSHVSVGHFCLDNTVTTVCAAGSWNKAGDRDAMFMLSDVPFDVLSRYLPADISTSGFASVEINANQTRSGALEANGEILSNTGRISFKIDENTSQEFTINSLMGKFMLVDETLTGELSIQSTNSLLSPLQASISLSPFKIPVADYASMNIDGHFNWMVDDLSFASNILPHVADVGGKLAIDLSVDGDLVEPNLAGNVLLENARMMLPEYGIELLDVNVKGQPALEDTFKFTGQARSGEGQITFNATIISEDTTQQIINASIQGNKFELINIPEVRAYANTDLVIELSRAKTNLSGNIEVHDALIDLKEIRETVTLSDDVVLVERPSTEKQETRSDIRLDIDLKDNIEIKGQGIVGHLTGGIVIFSTENGELLGNGEISIIDGNYAAYGQSLEIEEGRFIYSNQQLENPELRIRAVRHIDDITVGLTVTGFLSNPLVTLISSPTLRDEEILSYIVFGRSLDTLTSAEGTNLIGAATAMGLNNSDFITRSLSSSFGLDQLELSSDSDGQNASLTVGKYITPKIFISYVMGLMEPLSIARIRYNLNKKWSLEANSSAESMGVDVYYSIEK